MSNVLLYLALLSAPAMTASTGADRDRAIAWACTYEWAGNNLSVSLGRYLSDDGRQQEISGDWEILGSSQLWLSGLLWSRSGDPPSEKWTAGLGWYYQDYEKDAASDPMIVVGGGPIPAKDRPQPGTTELSTSWLTAKSLARNGRIAARLVGKSGQTLRSGVIDMRDVRLTETRLQQALASTRLAARNYKQRCMRFNPVPIGNAVSVPAR